MLRHLFGIAQTFILTKVISNSANCELATNVFLVVFNLTPKPHSLNRKVFISDREIGIFFSKFVAFWILSAGLKPDFYDNYVSL